MASIAVAAWTILAVSVLAQPPSVSRVSVRLFPVFEGVSTSNTPDEEVRTEEGLEIRWRGPVRLTLGDAVITADDAPEANGPLTARTVIFSTLRPVVM